MAGRSTNLALLVLVVVAALTGFLSFTFGTASAFVVVVLHAISGLAILVLTPWKGSIAKRSIRREGWRHGVSILLSVTTVIAIITGIMHSTGWLIEIGPLATMQLHVGFGVAVVALALAHFGMKTTRPRPTDVNRRNLIRAGALVGVAGAGYIALETMMRWADSPGSRRRFTGSHQVDSARPNGFPTTQWLDDDVQHVGDGFIVEIGDQALTPDDLDSGDTVIAVLDCTGGWYVERSWTGTRLDRLVNVSAGESIRVGSVTGYWRRFPIGDASNLYLVTHVDGEPLSDGHGGPVRLVAPGRRGFQWVKWVDEVSINSTPWWWQPPLPIT